MSAIDEAIEAVTEITISVVFKGERLTHTVTEREQINEMLENMHQYDLPPDSLSGWIETIIACRE